MKTVNANRVGLACAAVLAGWHAVWVVLVAIGVAQQVYDFAFRLHGMKPYAAVGSVDLAMAGLLLLATGGIGYVSGYGATWVWNCLQRLEDRGCSAGQRADAASSPSPRRAA